MTVRHVLYSDIGIALSDMMRLVDEDVVDACAILTLRDDVIALILGFEASRRTCRCAIHRADRLREAGRELRRASVADARRRFSAAPQERLLPALHDPLFVRDGVVHDRTVVFSRLIWRYWAARRS